MRDMWTTIDGFKANHAFSTRCGGVSPSPFDSLDFSLSEGDERERTDENARRFARKLGLSIEDIAAVRQVHGTRIVRVVRSKTSSKPAGHASWDTSIPSVRTPSFSEDVFEWPDSTSSSAPTTLRAPLCDADGLVTDELGLALAIRTADCAPILIASIKEDRRAIAAIHAGWRGTVNNIVQKAVATMQAHFGILPKDLIAAIGPCIDPCCYEVSGEIAQKFADAFGNACVVQSSSPGATPRLSLKIANAQALENSGILASNIFVSDQCTACAKDLFFSYRRDGGKTGRHLSLIWLGRD